MGQNLVRVLALLQELYFAVCFALHLQIILINMLFIWGHFQALCPCNTMVFSSLIINMADLLSSRPEAGNYFFRITFIYVFKFPCSRQQKHGNKNMREALRSLLAISYHYTTSLPRPSLSRGQSSSNQLHLCPPEYFIALGSLSPQTTSML